VFPTALEKNWPLQQGFYLLLHLHCDVLLSFSWSWPPFVTSFGLGLCLFSTLISPLHQVLRWTSVNCSSTFGFYHGSHEIKLGTWSWIQDSFFSLSFICLCLSYSSWTTPGDSYLGDTGCDLKTLENRTRDH
jgi:hypothetical protein